MKKFSILFCIAYLILTFGFGSIAEALQIDAGVTFNIVATIVAVLIAAWWFSHDQKRRPTPDEISAFSFQGLCGVWVASIVLTTILLTFFVSGAEIMALLSEMGVAVLIFGGIFVTIVISLLYYFVIRWSFSGFTKLFKPA